MLLLLFGVINGSLVCENAVTKIHKICSLQHERGPRDVKQTTRQIGHLRLRFNKRLGSIMRLFWVTNFDRVSSATLL